MPLYTYSTQPTMPLHTAPCRPCSARLPPPPPPSPPCKTPYILNPLYKPLYILNPSTALPPPPPHLVQQQVPVDQVWPHIHRLDQLFQGCWLLGTCRGVGGGPAFQGCWLLGTCRGMGGTDSCAATAKRGGWVCRRGRFACSYCSCSKPHTTMQ